VEVMAKSLLTKHGKYYELNPYKIIQRIEEIREKVFYLYQDMENFYQEVPVKHLFKDIELEIDGLIEDMYDQGQLPR